MLISEYAIVQMPVSVYMYLYLSPFSCVRSHFSDSERKILHPLILFLKFVTCIKTM